MLTKPVAPMPGVAMVEVHDLTNAAFFARYAAPGRVGLVGGSDWIDRNIRRAQKGARVDRKPSDWSHAYLCGERRADGEHWVFESDLDLDVGGKHRRLGVQENRITRFSEAEGYNNLAILDFQLTPEQVQRVFREALDLLASRTEYSLREIAGTLLALNQRGLRGRDNVLARDGAMYCSAFVQHCFATIGLDFQPAVPTKNTTPEDIATTPIPHTCYVLVRHRLQRHGWEKLKDKATQTLQTKVVAKVAATLPKKRIATKRRS